MTRPARSRPPLRRRARSAGRPRRAGAARGAALGLALAAALAGCGPQPARPTIVLVTLDTTRADHLGTYGYHRPTDPYLQSLAARSVVFEDAIAPSTWSLPSHVSLFTGLDAAEHGAYWREHPEQPGERLDPPIHPSTPMLTDPLDQAGYFLIGAAGGPFTAARFGFDRGFDRYLDPGERAWLPGTELNAWLFEALDARPAGAPLFLFVNYFDAHEPYAAPNDGSYPFPEGVGDLEPVVRRRPGEGGLDPEWIARAVDQYDRELLVQDRALQSLMAELERRGLLDDALVIVTADHGEFFGEHDRTGHNGIPFEPVARVPLVVHRTGVPPGRRPGPASLCDVPATVLAAAGLPELTPGGGLPRHDLLDRPAEPTPVYTEDRSPDHWIGVVRGQRFKYFQSLPAGDAPPTFQVMVDLASDPHESVDETIRQAPAILVQDEQAATQARALSELMRHLERTWRRPPPLLPAARLTPQQRKVLEELGYM